MQKKRLDQITVDDFKSAMNETLDIGITSVAPLGSSGETIYIHGCNRISEVSVRNYNGSPELLITDANKSFLFCGRFKLCLGVDFLAEQYFNIFKLLESSILTDTRKVEVKYAETVTKTIGFEMMKNL